MAFYAQLQSNYKDDFGICSVCKLSTNTVRLYSKIYDKNKAQETYGSKSKIDVNLNLFCCYCLEQEIRKDYLFNAAYNVIDQRINNFTLEDANFKQKITQLEEQINKNKSLIGNEDEETLVKELNISEMAKHLMCLKDLSSDIGDIYKEDQIHDIDKFKNIESASKFIYSQFKLSLAEIFEKLLTGVHTEITKDLEYCQEKEQNLYKIQQEFIRQYEQEIEKGTFSAEKFSIFIDEEQKSRKIEAKKSALEKALHIKEMMIKYLNQ